MSPRHALRRLSHCITGPILVAGVIATAPGCSNPFGRSCTLIGCDDGIRLKFETPPPDGTVVELGGLIGVPWRVECGVDWDCRRDIFFASFTPGQFSVRVVTPAGEVTEYFEPTYEESRPNGEDCPPTCRIATVVMGLPG